MMEHDDTRVAETLLLGLLDTLESADEALVRNGISKTAVARKARGMLERISANGTDRVAIERKARILLSAIRSRS